MSLKGIYAVQCAYGSGALTHKIKGDDSVVYGFTGCSDGLESGNIPKVSYEA